MVLTHTGTVRNYTNFGVFVELEEGIDGLVYISDLSWTKKIKHPSDFVTVGDKLEVQVLELDVENRKLNLGHKQTQDNPWDVTFPDGVEGFAPSRFLEKEDGTKLGKGETLKFIVLEFSKEYRRVVISHTSIFKDQERKNIKAQAKKSQDAERTTLGDIGGLAALKKKMEEGNKKK